MLCLSFSNTATAKKKKVVEVVVTSTFINMHTGPGRGFPVFHVLEKGETITLIKRKTDWIKAETSKGVIGWIYRASFDETIGINGELVKLGIPDRDDYSQRRWEVGVSLGEFEDVESLGVHGAYRFTKNLSAELRFNQATGSSSNSKLVSLGLVHQPFPEWKISPFFTVANGQVSIEPNSDISTVQDLEDSFFLVGFGAYYYYSHRFMIRFEYNNYTTLPDRNSNEDIDEWKIGLSAFF
jgi:uncharacterized protein YgiM (DUF1202 family)